MKKWVFCFVILVSLLFGYGVRETKLNADNEIQLNEGKQAQEASSSMSELHIDADQIYKGDLLLVNKDHPVHPESEETGAVNLSEHLELVNGFRLLDNEIELSPSLARKFADMVKAAKNDGVSHFIVNSGYRNHEEQNQLYAEKGADYALPAGYSEHNLGLSLDIGSTQAEMSQALEGKWLKKNAWRYGFILRYPEDKTAVTGIEFEPWHFRYVGLPHSAVMEKKNFALEEYLDYLKDKKQITITIDDEIYEISYYPITGDTTIPVPAKGGYELSGNNKDGVIVTTQIK
ncbi:D-alanyl-D-alanine carboxypeptidase family protein [Paenibacillus sp. CF384]|uniref:M15 family metallopeptidase n=1 Tax=Paenibacillus sp. CF384 TaxID=1884382 RepID=UPI000897A320|nr:M15 family metallopeptidase [Paenibacillus sp. CF384]SDX94328.1 D-Ala-D-Ala carboxypeptidase. Metallo peptidase. MEROPS family M15B [Paenibacillus sp. CF384]